MAKETQAKAKAAIEYKPEIWKTLFPDCVGKERPACFGSMYYRVDEEMVLCLTCPHFKDCEKRSVGPTEEGPHIPKEEEEDLEYGRVKW